MSDESCESPGTVMGLPDAMCISQLFSLDRNLLVISCFSCQIFIGSFKIFQCYEQETFLYSFEKNVL